MRSLRALVAGCIIAVSALLGTAQASDDAVPTSATVASVAVDRVPSPVTITIGDDFGGQVWEFAKWFGRIARAEGLRLKIDGVCLSSCTLFFIVPFDRVCITRRSSLGFHLASEGKVADPDFTVVMGRRWYPKVIIDWIASKPPLKLEKMTWMSGDEAIAIGAVKECTE